MAQDGGDAAVPRRYRGGVVALWVAIGSPVLGFVAALPNGNWVIPIAATFVGGIVAATAGQWAISDARDNGDRAPRGARVGRCLGWLEVILPLVLLVLFYIALSQAEFVF